MKKWPIVEFYKTRSGRWAWVVRAVNGSALGKSARTYTRRNRAKQSYASCGARMLSTSGKEA